MATRPIHVFLDKFDDFEADNSSLKQIAFYTYGDQLDLEIDVEEVSLDIYLKPPELRAFIEKLESIEKQMAKARLDKI